MRSAVMLAMLAAVAHQQPLVMRAEQSERRAGEHAAAATARNARWFYADRRSMTPHELVRLSQQRRRARQTHRHKRAKR